MPKHLVTAIGLIVSLGILALGVFLVAVPMYFQGVSVDGQTATVASTNAIYQSEVDHLRMEEENLDAINEEVVSLRAQIPAVGHLDDVFEVAARAAEGSRVVITSVTAGEAAPFVARTAATGTTDPVAPASDVSADSADQASGESAPGGADVSAPDPQTSAGRQQVDFVIAATGSDMAQAIAFVDALRSGPRLLSNITVRTLQAASGSVDVQVSALTYVDAEG
ncbi:hypothetical protein GCM10022200_01720 [Microbacterium awajiense]|uniref:Uncharacterized protein n=1 Tax=Microbacterium awajiense TaxID=415214 RepID=A0ABP7A1M7_9MICO